MHMFNVALIMAAAGVDGVMVPLDNYRIND